MGAAEEVAAGVRGVDAGNTAQAKLTRTAGTSGGQLGGTDGLLERSDDARHAGRADARRHDSELVAADPGQAVLVAHDLGRRPSATAHSTASPTGWPCSSLIALKRSKSNSTSAAPVGARPIACSSAASNAAAVVEARERVALGHHALARLGAQRGGA